MPIIGGPVRKHAVFDDNATRYEELLATLRTRHREVAGGGGERLRRRHIERGKIPVRQRIDHLVDPLSPFLELSPLAAWGLYGGDVPAAGIVTGIGMICDTPCMIIANDATVKGGSFFHETVKKHLRAQEIAFENHLPCVYLVDCGGAFLPEQDRVFPDRDHFGGTFFPAVPHVRGGPSADLGGVWRLHSRRRLHSGAVGRGRDGARYGSDPSRRSADRQGGHQRDRRRRDAGRRRDAHDACPASRDYLAETELEAIAKIRDIVGALKLARSAPSRRSHGTAPRLRSRGNTGHRRRRPQAPLRRARGDRPPRRRQRVPGIQAGLWLDAGLRLRLDSRRAGRHSRQQRRAVLRIRREGRAFHRTVRPAPRPRSCFCRTSPASWSAPTPSAAASPSIPPSSSTPSPTRECPATP